MHEPSTHAAQRAHVPHRHIQPRGGARRHRRQARVAHAGGAHAQALACLARDARCAACCGAGFGVHASGRSCGRPGWLRAPPRPCRTPPLALPPFIPQLPQAPRRCLQVCPRPAVRPRGAAGPARARRLWRRPAGAGARAAGAGRRCHRAGVGWRAMGWGSLQGRAQEAGNLVWCSCIVCATFPGVHWRMDAPSPLRTHASHHPRPHPLRSSCSTACPTSSARCWPGSAAPPTSSLPTCGRWCAWRSSARAALPRAVPPTRPPPCGCVRLGGLAGLQALHAGRVAAAPRRTPVTYSNCCHAASRLPPQQAHERWPALAGLLGDRAVADLYLRLLCQFEPRSGEGAQACCLAPGAWRFSARAASHARLAPRPQHHPCSPASARPLRAPRPLPPPQCWPTCRRTTRTAWTRACATAWTTGCRWAAAGALGGAARGVGAAAGRGASPGSRPPAPGRLPHPALRSRSPPVRCLPIPRARCTGPPTL